MGEKKNTESKEGENKKNDNGGGKDNVTLVLKADLHCQGCASKVIKCGYCDHRRRGPEYYGGRKSRSAEAQIKKQKKKKKSKNNSSECRPDEKKFKEKESMDMKALAEILKKNLEKIVEIVPAKKEGEKKDRGSGDKKKGAG